MEQVNAHEKMAKYNELNTIMKNEREIKTLESVKPHCPYCNSTNVYGMSRVVGYFSIIENWNKSKKAELKRRQKGNYWYHEK